MDKIYRSLILLLPLVLVFITPQSRGYWCFKYEVLDGDTLQCRGGRKVRFWAIDAPESDQRAYSGEPIGLWSTEGLKQLLKRRPPLKILVREVGFYGRDIAEIFIGNQSLNLMMVEEGIAVLYPRCRASLKERIEYENALFRARMGRRGLWKTHGFKAPWKYRKETFSLRVKKNLDKIKP